jgi:hypothetical protein
MVTLAKKYFDDDQIIVAVDDESYLELKEKIKFASDKNLYGICMLSDKRKI